MGFKLAQIHGRWVFIGLLNNRGSMLLLSSVSATAVQNIQMEVQETVLLLFWLMPGLIILLEIFLTEQTQRVSLYSSVFLSINPPI